MQQKDSNQDSGRGEWSSPKPEILTEPTWWPAALALGCTLLAWGLVTSWVILVIGISVFVVSLAGWIADIRHEQAEASAASEQPKH